MSIAIDDSGRDANEQSLEPEPRHRAPLDLTTGHDLMSYLCGQLRGTAPVMKHKGKEVRITQVPNTIVLKANRPNSICSGFAVLRGIRINRPWPDTHADLYQIIEAAMSNATRISIGPIARIIGDYARRPMALISIHIPGSKPVSFHIGSFPWCGFPEVPLVMEKVTIKLMPIIMNLSICFMLDYCQLVGSGEVPTNLAGLYLRDYQALWPLKPIDYGDAIWPLMGELYMYAEIDVGPQSHFAMTYTGTRGINTIALELVPLGQGAYNVHLYVDANEVAASIEYAEKVVDFISSSCDALAEWINARLPMFMPSTEFARQLRLQVEDALIPRK
jgi:hypothetical protein